MGHYIFDEKIAMQNISALERAKGDVKAYLNSRALFGHNSDPEKDIDSCLINFFKAKHIQDLVKQNAWMDVFTCWRRDWYNLHSQEKEDNEKYYGNKPGWPLYPLVHFLYLTGIYFEDYLTEKNIPGVSDSDIRYSGLVWVED